MRAFCVLILYGFASTVCAYQFMGGRWPTPEATMHFDLVDTQGRDRAPSGMRWNDGFREAMERWNGSTGFTFHGDEGTALDPCRSDGQNGVGFREDNCGFVFGRTTLAITYTQTRAGLIEEADIVFNGTLDWDIYSGPLRRREDFVRVATHELGHVLGLDHEDSGVPAIMTSLVSDLEFPQKDDMDGVAVLYDVRNPQPEVCSPQIVIPLNQTVEGDFGISDCQRRFLADSPFDSDDSFVDLYRFQLPVAALVVVQLESDEVDSYLELYDREHQHLIAWDDDSGAGLNAMLYARLEPGEYLVQADTALPWVQTGGYRLQVRVNLDQPPAARLTDDWNIVIDAVEVNGGLLHGELLAYANPLDPAGLYWRLGNIAAGGAPERGGVVYFPGSRSVIFNPIIALGRRYDAVLQPYVNPADPTGWYWRLESAWPR
ncbi:hypothetical protein MIT9_P1085 [Methylomarinovum caldicuralii]|uniref:Peptidase metallopeptidase domain-containing protein n=1 Tax=Methylomarinovum caldicuralii TaxID=438856 RepID=A0AAU9CPR5_9GAMM|nr:matrixin family metalloprotease [Methylomarinovum caldicuralii]BCX81507.1 hypothetical protein MIT9_P1085 [Methylomarinovum caldicuralii]